MGRGAAPPQEGHWFDGGRKGRSNTISSTKYDGDPNTTNYIIVCDESSEVEGIK